MNANNDIAAESLALRIKRLRIASGLTQGQLGERIGISSTSVGKWEAGEFLPKGRYVAQLAVALGIDVAALLGETPKSIDDLAEEVQLIAAFRSLTKERRLIAIKLIEAGLHKRCNALWVVTSRPGVQLERLMRTRGLSEADARVRIEAQPPQSEKAALADVLIENNGTLDNLREQVKRYWEELAASA